MPAHTPDRPVLTREQLEFFHREGYLVAKDVIPRSVIERVAAEIDVRLLSALLPFLLSFQARWGQTSAENLGAELGRCVGGRAARCVLLAPCSLPAFQSSQLGLSIVPAECRRCACCCALRSFPIQPARPQLARALSSAAGKISNTHSELGYLHRTEALYAQVRLAFTLFPRFLLLLTFPRLPWEMATVPRDQRHGQRRRGVSQAVGAKAHRGQGLLRAVSTHCS